MISRIWHGWTSPSNAEAYEQLLREKILPGISARNIPGYRGAHLLKRDAGDEIEFVTICWFEDMDAVREFAGEDYRHSVVPDSARKLLSRFDDQSRHYDTLKAPE